MEEKLNQIRSDVRPDIEQLAIQVHHLAVNLQYHA